MTVNTAKAPVATTRAPRCAPHSVAGAPSLRYLRRRASPSRQRGASRLWQPAAPPPATAPSSPTPTAPHASPASSVASASLRRPTPSRVRSPAASPPAVRGTEGPSLLAPCGHSSARATAVGINKRPTSTTPGALSPVPTRVCRRRRPSLTCQTRRPASTATQIPVPSARTRRRRASERACGATASTSSPPTAGPVPVSSASAPTGGTCGSASPLIGAPGTRGRVKLEDEADEF